MGGGPDNSSTNNLAPADVPKASVDEPTQPFVLAGSKRENTGDSSGNDSSGSGTKRRVNKKRRVKVVTRARPSRRASPDRVIQKPGNRHFCLLLRSDSFSGPPMVH